jgi:predicted aspartyl protease
MNKAGIYLICTLAGMLFLCSTITAKERSQTILKVSDKKLYTPVQFNKKLSAMQERYKNVSEDSLLMKDYCEIPFIVELTGRENKTNNLYLKVRIDNKDFLFIYDTGSAVNIMTDKTLERIGISIDESVNETLFLMTASAKCSGRRFGRNVFLYVPGTSFGTDANGEDIAGIIGLDFFRSAESLCIDYKSRKIILNDEPASYSGLEKLSLIPDNDGTFLQYKIKVNLDGTEGVALFDTGCTWIEVRKNNFNLSVKRMEWMSVVTILGQETVKNYYADAGNIYFGSTVLKNAEVIMWDDYAYSYFPQFKDKDMVLGINGFFDRYKVWFFPSEGYVCIQPYEGM